MGSSGIPGEPVGSGLWLSFRNARPELLGLLSQERPQMGFLGNILIIQFE